MRMGDINFNSKINTSRVVEFVAILHQPEDMEYLKNVLMLRHPENKIFNDKIRIFANLFRLC